MEKNEQILFPVNVEVGKYYTVPCVKVISGIYLAISSYLHNDKKIIGIGFDHWHIDWRFVSENVWQSECVNSKYSSYGSIVREVGIPVVYNDDPEQNTLQGYNHPITSTYDKTVYYKRLLCKREYSAGQFFELKSLPDNNWVPKMQKHFCGSKLKREGDKLICPHKGILIDKKCKDKEGNYVCPGHLLRFNPETLECIKTT